MLIARFVGRVLPSAVDLNFFDMPEITWPADEIGFPIVFHCRITRSLIQIDCEIPRYHDEYLSALHKRAYDLARCCTDLVSFASGHGLTVILETFIRPDGVGMELLSSRPDLAAECTAYKAVQTTPEEKNRFSEVLRIVITEPALFLLFNDLVQVLTMPNAVPHNCGRVLEGLRKLVTPGLDPKQGWKIFRETIQADEAYLSFITEHSKLPRHGDKSFMSAATAVELSKRTWIIMNRFLEFRKRGSLPLPLTDFHLLTG